MRTEPGVLGGRIIKTVANMRLVPRHTVGAGVKGALQGGRAPFGKKPNYIKLPK